MQFAECVYKKNWDQVGPGPDRPRHESRTSRGTGKPAKKNASAAFSGRFSPILKRIVLCTTDKT